MKLTVIGSSSKGNGYVIHDEKEALVIEAGVSLRRLKEAVSFNMSKIDGCIITHEHGDHAKHANSYIKNGVDVYMSLGTANNVNLDKYSRYYRLESKKPSKIGNFTVLPFKTEHDATEPLGFLVNHPKIGNLLFLTDSYYSRFKFKNLNHVIVEANYDVDIINDMRINNKIHPHYFHRLFSSHMSIQTTIELLKDNDISDVRNIMLIHLSDKNSNEKSFKQRIVEATGIPTTIADAGVEIDLEL